MVSLEQSLRSHPGWPSLSCFNSVQWPLKPSGLVPGPGHVLDMSLEMHKVVLTAVELARPVMVTTVPHAADLLLSREQWGTGRGCPLRYNSFIAVGFDWGQF